MENNQIINLLTAILGIMIVILVILCITFIILKIKTSKENSNQKKETIKKPEKKKVETATVKTYNKESIFKFLEFDEIKDNMIVQKNGRRYLMVIECQGINYDLMSGLEKNSVEQGFLEFLNTLRYPIQIYIQTRTVNLGNSINKYKEKVDNISRRYINKQSEYNQKLRSGQFSEKELEKENYELTRERNLYEYAIDIVSNTERMSLNKNILSKYYYIIIPYYPEEASNSNYTKDELSSLAFSELYTKSQAIISSLSVCEIKSKVLDSTELVELLYTAYNRDESETFSLERALNSGYEDLYSTAPDVLDKRMKELDIKIEQDAIKKANEVIYSAIEENQKQRAIRQRESELDNLIDEMAIALIEENKKDLGPEVTNIAINSIEKEKKERTEKTKEEEGGEENVKKEKTTKRRTTRAV